MPLHPSPYHQPSFPYVQLAALSFIQSVKDAFHADFPSSDFKYCQFLAVLQDYKDQRIDISQLTRRCSALFQGHPELIPAFNSFLPFGWTVILPPYLHSSMSSLQSRRAYNRCRPSDVSHNPEALDRSLRFLERIKDRFTSHEGIDKRYSALVNALKLPLLTHQSMLQLRAQVKEILGGHPDLYEEFNQFIPIHEASFDTEATHEVKSPQWATDDNPLSPDCEASSETSSAMSTSPGSPTVTIRSASTPPSSRHASPASSKRRRCAPKSLELMSLTLDAVVRDQENKATYNAPNSTPRDPDPLPFYPTLSTSVAYHQVTTHPKRTHDSTRSTQEFSTPSKIELQFNSTPNVDLRHNGIFEDASVHQYAPVIYPFNVAAGRKSTLEVRNWTWEASNPNPDVSNTYRHSKRPLDSATSDEPKRKKQFLRLSGGGSADGMFGAIGDGRVDRR